MRSTQCTSCGERKIGQSNANAKIQRGRDVDTALPVWNATAHISLNTRSGCCGSEIGNGLKIHLRGASISHQGDIVAKQNPVLEGGVTSSKDAAAAAPFKKKQKQWPYILTIKGENRHMERLALNGLLATGDRHILNWFSH